MARITYVKKAQQRYATVPVIDPETGTQKVIPVFRKDGVTPKKTKAGKEITRRVTVADKSQPLPDHRCEKCGWEIKVGESYKWIKPKSGPYGGRTRYRCSTCRNWRPSETTSSTIKGIVYSAQENFDDITSGLNPEGGLDAIIEAINDVAEGYREAAEAARESASNIEDGFGHPTFQSEELEERADSLESAADSCESWDGEDFDEEEPTLEDFSEEEDPDAALADAIGEWEDQRQSWFEDQISNASDTVQECEE